MKRILLATVLLGIIPAATFAQTTTNASAAVENKSDAQAKSDADIEKRATEWTVSLKLDDAAKAERVQKVIATHLKAVRDWNNDHPYTTVPAGINPYTGKALSQLDRQIIAVSAQPKSIHENLMAGLRQDLGAEQVEAVLDKYTEGKVQFTLRGYHAIVADLTDKEEAAILDFLKQAREQAVDFKGSKQISAIFEIYKTKSEQYLNANGRNWHQLFGDYVKAAKAKKAAAATNAAPAKALQ